MLADHPFVTDARRAETRAIGEYRVALAAELTLYEGTQVLRHASDRTRAALVTDEKRAQAARLGTFREELEIILLRAVGPAGVESRRAEEHLPPPPPARPRPAGGDGG